MSRNVTILGSTGSIGTQSLQVCKNLGDKVIALTANKNSKLLEKQAREYHPRYVAVTDQNAFSDLKIRLKDTDIKVLGGLESLCEVAALPENDIVLNAVVGMVGLKPTLSAITAGKEIALANKETLVIGGELVKSAAQKYRVRILPVDSEHSAIFQCLQGNNPKQLRKIILTASGGPFFGFSAEQLKAVTKAQALKHPNWEMGAKITIDSATLMNKGLEFIEAVHLFDLAPDQIEIVVHRESILHSAVEYNDGSVIAQMGVPDMKIPIQYALTYPNRLSSGVKPLSLTDIKSLTFHQPDYETFYCLSAAKKAIAKGGLLPTVLNGSNEQAVALFLQDKIKFYQIGEAVARAVEEVQTGPLCTLEDIIEADALAREFVLRYFS